MPKFENLKTLPSLAIMMLAGLISRCHPPSAMGITQSMANLNDDVILSRSSAGDGW